MQHKPVSIFSTGRFSQLMRDYVNEEPSLKPLYNRPHKRESYLTQIKEKLSNSIDRELLADIILEQYERINLAKDFPKVYENVEILRDKSSFTVTTGHQLCLFTGPLFFIYKIVNTLRLAEELTEETGNPIVPIFWMATEDHDFEEVNHVWYGDIKYTWEKDAGDAVGRMSTEGVSQVISNLQKATGDNRHVSDLLALFERCYRSGKSLAEATRELATELFGKYGLVVLDADDARLKSKMIEVFKSEMVERETPSLLESSSELLEKNYFSQVTPRDINLFYLRDGERYRLTELDGKIVTVDGPHIWNVQEVISELEAHPERFSPNVILRPLYQEMILPNLCYIGGGGELAYWLQLKPLFDYWKVTFPILRLRNSVGFIRRRFQHKMDSLGLNVEGICDPLFEQKRNHFRAKLSLNGEMDELRADADEVFSSLEDLATRIDKSLIGTAQAYNARQLHLLQNFEKKVLNAAKRRDAEVERMFDEIHAEAFPGGSLQERRDTWLTIVERFGPDTLETLMTELDPFDHTFSWFTE